MGKQKNKFPPSLRWALWTAHGMKCFWCKKVLDFSDCEVDHVIPQSTTKIVLASLSKDYQLGPDFSVNAMENFVPACRPCTKRRAKGAFRTDPALPNWFNAIRFKIPLIEAKIQQIESDQSTESLFKSLLQKLEAGELKREDVERLAGPFLQSVEGQPKGTLEFRLAPTVRIFYSPEGVRMQPPSEIKYENFVDRMVEGGEWKKKSRELREGPSFGEGRRRPPGSGA